MCVVSALIDVEGKRGLSPARRLPSARHPPRASDNDIPTAARTRAGHTTSGSSAAGETDEVRINHTAHPVTVMQYYMF